MSESLYYTISTIISIIVTCLTLFGTIFACIQLWQIKTNRIRQFEQARREKTVQMVSQYNHDTSFQTKATIKIVSQLSDEQCADLYNGTPFEVDSKIQKLLCDICDYKDGCQVSSSSGKKACVKEDTIWIEGKVLHSLRGHTMAYLNALECVMLAWQLGIVDQEVLEEQFVFLDKKRHKERALETFRMVAGGGKSYPAIEKFYQHLDQKREKEAAESLKDILN